MDVNDDAEFYKSMHESRPLDNWELRQLMPISESELIEIVRALSQNCEECHHNFVTSEAILSHHPKKNEIIQWFCLNGFVCDCRVIMNLPERYYDLFEDYLNEDFSDEEHIEAPAKPELTKVNHFTSSVGLKLQSVSHSWTLYRCTLPNKPDWYELFFGKRKFQSEFSVSLFFEKLSDDYSDTFFIQRFASLNHIAVEMIRRRNPESISLSSHIGIDRQTVQLGDRDVQLVKAHGPDFTSIDVWIYDLQNPSWHFNASIWTRRGIGDLKELIKLLKTFHYQP